jgi:uncharacterized membrane protein YtjA (UPF0391 family)
MLFRKGFRIAPEVGTGLVALGRAVPLRGPARPIHYPEIPMLHYALIFFVVAIIAAVLGFGGVAGAAAGIAKILFFVFLILFVVSLVMGRKPRV